MKRKKLALIHTSAIHVPLFHQLCERFLPGVDVFNMVDDSFLKDVIKCGELTPNTAMKVVNYIGSAESTGADFIMVTCSSIGVAVETAASVSSVPVLREDEPMADVAVQMATRIGVVATLATTLEPTSDLVRRRAMATGKEIKLTTKLCEGAFEAWVSGEVAKHDEIVAKALKELSTEVDVILLAQASMARVLDSLNDEENCVPILASPALAIQHLASVL